MVMSVSEVVVLQRPLHEVCARPSTHSSLIMSLKLSTSHWSVLESPK